MTCNLLNQPRLKPFDRNGWLLFYIHFLIFVFYFEVSYAILDALFSIFCATKANNVAALLYPFLPFGHSLT